MAKPYDDGLKYLVRANPRAFVLWLLASAQFVAQRPYELKNWKMEMDSLIEVIVNGMSMLLHIEFQTHHDDDMNERILRYNVLARSEYKLPVLSIVIYLPKDDKAPLLPMIWTVPTGLEVLHFHYESITLADLPSDALLKLQPVVR